MTVLLSTKHCPSCGHTIDPPAEVQAHFRPWSLHDRGAVFAYVSSLSKEKREWLLALYVDADLNLLSVHTAAIGTFDACDVDIGKILCSGRAEKAAGFFLVHNHPSGDARASKSDIEMTRRLSQIARDFDMPLIEHFVVAGEEMKGVIWE